MSLPFVLCPETRPIENDGLLVLVIIVKTANFFYMSKLQGGHVPQCPIAGDANAAACRVDKTDWRGPCPSQPAGILPGSESPFRERSAARANASSRVIYATRFSRAETISDAGVSLRQRYADDPSYSRPTEMTGSVDPRQ